jgi:hypothetical protein
LTGLSVTITPSSATSKVLLLFSLTATSDTGGQPLSSRPGMIRLTGGNADDFIGNADGSKTRTWTATFQQTAGGNGRSVLATSGAYLDSPATTSAVTYGLEVAQPNAGTLFINRSTDTTNSDVVPVSASSLIAIEVAA